MGLPRHRQRRHAADAAAHPPRATAHGTDLGLMRASGVVLTHGYPKRFYQPVVSPIAIEAIEAGERSVSPNVLCTTLTSEHTASIAGVGRGSAPSPKSTPW